MGGEDLTQEARRIALFFYGTFGYWSFALRALGLYRIPIVGWWARASA